MTRDFWNGTQQYRRGFIATLDQESLKIMHLEHRLILDAMKRRDAHQASELLRLHIRRTRVGLANRRDLFEVPQS